MTPPTSSRLLSTRRRIPSVSLNDYVNAELNVEQKEECVRKEVVVLRGWAAGGGPDYRDDSITCYLHWCCCVTGVPPERNFDMC